MPSNNSTLSAHIIFGKAIKKAVQEYLATKINQIAILHVLNFAFIVEKGKASIG